MTRKKMKAAQNRSCHCCNKTFSKSEHLTRHLRSHTKERPYGCSLCGKLYSRSDVLRRHEKSHQRASPLSPDHAGQGGSATMVTPLSQETPQTSSLALGYSSTVPGLDDPSLIVDEQPSNNAQPAFGMSLGEPILNPDLDSWFFGSDLNVDVLDLTLSAAVSEWAQLPTRMPNHKSADVPTFYSPTPVPSRSSPADVPEALTDLVKQRWFSRIPVEEGTLSTQPISTSHASLFGQGFVAADEKYRTDLSQTLQPRMYDETLPSADQLNLFANLFFSRFNSLLPIVHLPSFKPTRENSLLFISICSVGSLFVGSAPAAAQGTRLFERLNKAILASWESILSHSRSDALSMVQAAVIGQTFAILSGRPKTLILADVLHGTVMTWARESNKIAQQSPHDRQILDPARADLDEQWVQWIDHEQRKRVEIALNIHDAELASLLHHEPLRRHRLTQHPHVASDALFTAPTAARWAELYRTTTTTPHISLVNPDDPLQATVAYSKFSAYGVLESINAYVIEARRSNAFDEHESRRLSNMLMRWWQIYIKHYAVDAEGDFFNLPVLWHSIFIAIYIDVDLLEQASGRDGETVASTSAPLIRSWVTTLDASRCLVHALLIQRYLEQMRVSSEPAIHVPRAMFTAALAWFCFTRIGGGRIINATAFDAPEIQLVKGVANAHDPHGQLFEGATLASQSHLHRMIDLLGRLGRWAISESFSSALCAALDRQQSA